MNLLTISGYVIYCLYEPADNDEDTEDPIDDLDIFSSSQNVPLAAWHISSSLQCWNSYNSANTRY
jgi:hypothetical protein